MTSSHQHAARALLANHYLIIPIKPNEKRPGISGWQNARLGASDVPRLWSNGAGIGVLCGVGAQPVVAVDIDVLAEDFADTIERWCELELGPTIVRIGRAPKRLLVYRAAGTGWPKLTSPMFYDASGTSHKIEVLCRGQQFVAYGQHPDTGRTFEWVDLLGGMTGVAAPDLPVVQHDALLELIERFRVAAGARGWTEKRGDRAGRREPDLAAPLREAPRLHMTDSHEYDALDELVASSAIDAGNERGGDERGFLAHFPSMGLPITVAANAITNLPAHDYDTWIRVGMGLHHEYASGGDATKGRAAFETWRNWSETAGGDKYKGEHDCETHWASFGRSVMGSGEPGSDGGGSDEVGPGKRPGGRGSGAAPITLLSVLGMAGVPVRLKPDGSYAVGSEANTVRRAKTEMGNAERMLDQFGAGLMYVPELKQWYRWTGLHWARALGVEIEHLAKSTVLALRDEIELWPEGDERESFYRFCAASQKSVMVQNMIKLASSDPRVVVPASELDKDWRYLGVRNGVVDLATGVLLPPDRERRVTMCAGCDYVPGARNELWEQTVADVFFEDRELVGFFHRLAGYTLCGNPTEDVLAIPFGEGSNGKSTLMTVLTAVLGQYAHTAAAETFVGGGRSGGASQVGPRPDLLAMRGARLVWVGEPEQGSELREAFVKSVSGGDPIPCRAMHSNEIVQVKPTWVAWMPTNHRPIVRGDDWAIWRRLLPVPFTRNFDADVIVTKDGHRDRRIMLESGGLSGVLAWLVRGAGGYLRAGLGAPGSVDMARSKYRDDMDLLAEWFSECCECRKNDATCVESNANLWLSWETFAKIRGELHYVSSQKALTRRLESRGFKRVANSTKRNVRGFAGICVKKHAKL